MILKIFDVEIEMNSGNMGVGGGRRCFELGLALGVSGVVGGGIGEVGQTHWSGLGTVFRYRGPQTGRTKKSTILNF